MEKRGLILKLLVALKENKEHRVQKVPQDHQEGVAHQEQLELEELRVPLEKQDLGEEMVSKVHLDCREKMVQMVNLETKDLKESLEPKDHQGKQDNLVYQV